MTFVWAMLFLIFIFIEIATVNLVTIWFAFGSIISLFAALFIEEWIWQLVIFIVSSLISLIITKPIVSKLKVKNFTPMNTDRVIGKRGEVVKKITPKDKGEVKVLGSIWTAISDTTLEVGEDVVVDKIEGVKLIVSKEKK